MHYTTTCVSRTAVGVSRSNSAPCDLTSRGFVGSKVLVVAQQARRCSDVFVGFQVLWQRDLSPHLGGLSHLQQHREKIYRGWSLSAERLHPTLYMDPGWVEGKQNRDRKRGHCHVFTFAIYYLWEAFSGVGMQIKVHDLSLSTSFGTLERCQGSRGNIFCLSFTALTVKMCAKHPEPAPLTHILDIH